MKCLDKEKEALIQWFSNIQADEKHTHILKNRQEGTCGYFLESPAFEMWVEGDEAKLWCIGARESSRSHVYVSANTRTSRHWKDYLSVRFRPDLTSREFTNDD